MSLAGKCPKCESSNVQSYDNESIWHARSTLKEGEDDYLRVDHEIYIHFICNACGHKYVKQYSIVPLT